jgi:hypothetical protein
VVANGAVALVVDDLVSRSPWTVREVEIRGHAEALVDQEPTSSSTSPEIIRIHPRRGISWGIGPEPGMRGRDVHRTAARAQPGYRRAFWRPSPCGRWRSSGSTCA